MDDSGGRKRSVTIPRSKEGAGGQWEVDVTVYVPVVGPVTDSVTVSHSLGTKRQ